MKFLFAVPLFFFLPLREMHTEYNPVCNRVYFIHKDRIVAVAIKTRD